MIVVDASLILDIVIVTSDAAALLSRLDATGEDLCAPELLDIEIIQVLRLQERLKRLTTARAAKAVEILGLLPIIRYDHALLRDRIWQLRNNLTAYDATYVALAEAFQASLWTRDSKFGAAPGHCVEIILV